MMMRVFRAALAIVLVIVLAAGPVWPPRPVLACGPLFAEPIFTYDHGPDVPLAGFAGSMLGILQPTYYRAYLVVAYRNLSGRPFDAAEQKALEAYFEEGTRPAGHIGTSSENWVKAWFEKRNSLLGKADRNWYWGDPVGIHRWNFRGDYTGGFYNCLSGAFHTAIETLDKRLAQFGAQSAEVRDWMEAQDQVFANCFEPFPTGGQKPRGTILPAEAKPDAPGIIRADRDYQLAAAHFYGGDFDEARAKFEKIAADASSPWQHVAPYLVARALLRKATLGAGEDNFDRAGLAQAQAQLDKVLADSTRSDLQPAARRLIAYIQIRLHSRERLRELAAALLEKHPETLEQDLTDYTFLLDRRFTLLADPEGAAPGKSRGELGRDSAAEAKIRSDDLTDWILTFQDDSVSALEHAYSKWQQTTALPWLLAALAKLHAPDARLETMLAAAKKVPPGSPGFTMAAFHTMRLLAESGNRDEARVRLDQLISSDPGKLPQSALNLFLALRMKLARNFEELLHSAVRAPSGVTYGEGSGVEPWSRSKEAKKPEAAGGLFDLDAAEILNRRLPLSELAKAAQSRELPAPLRKQITLAAWLRAILLEDEAVSRELTPAVATLAPGMKSDLESYSSAPDRKARGFAAAYALLKSPGVQLYVRAGVARGAPLGEIDNFRDNWWCSLAIEGQQDYSWASRKGQPVRERTPLRILHPDGQIETPGFVTAEERAAAEKEWQGLAAVPTAPNYLGGKVLTWAKEHPDDARVPEALHLVVRATRYGCGDADTGKFSKAAFTLLHTRYPKSEWAKKTKYWYGAAN